MKKAERMAVKKRRVKKTAAKKAAPKRAAAKKAAPKKAVAKRAAPKRRVAKKAAPKRAVRKKAAPKKAAPKRAARKSAPKKRAVRRTSARTISGPTVRFGRTVMSATPALLAAEKAMNNANAALEKITADVRVIRAKTILPRPVLHGSPCARN